jgi:DNA-binding NarL/FixJ family response regulator
MKILIADDHPIFLSGLRSLFENNKKMEVVGEAKNGQEAVSLVKKLKPDIVVMDINMPVMNGIEATKEILSIAASTKVIALSIHSDKQFVKEMLDAGAVGYLLKDDAGSECISAIEKVTNGDMFLSSGVTRAALSKDKEDGELSGSVQDSENTHEFISKREFEILKMIAEGFRNEQIAEKLFISKFTVKKHISNTFEKLEVHSRIKAIEKAKELKILK